MLFLKGLRCIGVLAGLEAFVGTIVGGAGNDCTLMDVDESVDMRFLERVGAMVPKFDCPPELSLYYRYNPKLFPKISNS